MNAQARKAFEACLAWLKAGAPHTQIEDSRYETELAGFGMHAYISRNECGTVVCMGGFISLSMGLSPYAASLFGDEALDVITEIPKRVVIDLFVPELFHEYGLTYDDITPERAARVLEHFLNTNVVDWSLAC